MKSSTRRLSTVFLAVLLFATMAGKVHGQAATDAATAAPLPSKEELRAKKKELDERERRLRLLEQPAPPEKIAELEQKQRNLENLKREAAQAELAVNLTEVALASLENMSDIRIEHFKIAGTWGAINGDAVLRKRPETQEAPVASLTPGQRVYVLAEVQAQGPWLLVVTGRKEVGFVNKAFVELSQEHKP